MDESEKEIKNACHPRMKARNAENRFSTADEKQKMRKAAENTLFNDKAFYISISCMPPNATRFSKAFSFANSPP